MRNKNAKVSDPNTFVCNPGSDEHILYASKVTPSGEIILTPCGKESISEKINAEKEFTDISFIISRLRMGDTSVLRDGAVYGDFYSAPKSLAEAMQLQIDAERKFYELPLTIRNQFNNNYRQWLIECGSNDWCIKMGIPTEPKVDETEVKETEVNVNDA